MNTANTKSQVAKLMATENITVQHKKAPTASFDVKNRVLTLPIMKDDLSVNVLDLMTSHEVGHALWTPEQGWSDKVAQNGQKFKTFLNIVEDARIEKKIKVKYPGLAPAYRNGYKELLDMDFFGIAGVDIETMPFIDRINLHFKLGTLIGLKFEGEEAEWVEKIGATDTFEEVVALTEELFAAEKEKAEQQLEEEMQELAAQGSEGDEDDDQEEGQGSSETDGDDDQEEGEGGASSNQYGDDDTDGGTGWDDEFDDEEIEDMPVDAEDLMGGDTDENQKNNEGRLTKQDGREVEYLMFGEGDYSDRVVDYKQVLKIFDDHNARPGLNRPGIKVEISEKLKTWRTDNQKIVNYMVKEFEMRKKADEFKRAKTAKSGELDMKKVFGYKFNDDLFKKVTTVTGGKNHGFVMYMDWSGSMAPNMSATIDQLLNLVMFCRKVKIPFEVYSFTDASTDKIIKPIENPKENHLYPEGRNLSLMQWFDSSMSLSNFNQAIENMFSVRQCLSNGRSYRFNLPREIELGGTPLDAALLCAPSVIAKFKKKTKAQIVNFVVLTDGESHSCSVWKEEYMHSVYTGYRTDTFLQDTVTKKTYKVKDHLTNSLLSAIGDRCQVNMIGFYIVDNKPRDIRQTFSRFGVWNVDIKKFRSDKFYELNNAGYDSYFIMPGGADMMTGSDEGLDVDAGASKAKIRSAFMKASKAKTANRVMLNRLMAQVA